MSGRASRRPIHPYAVLALALLLPGVGHIAIGQAPRGLVFAFSTLFFGLFTFLFSTPSNLYRPPRRRLPCLGAVDP